MKHLKHIIFFLVVSTFAFAQNSTRIFKKASIKDNGVLEVEVNDVLKEPLGISIGNIQGPREVSRDSLGIARGSLGNSLGKPCPMDNNRNKVQTLAWSK